MASILMCDRCGNVYKDRGVSLNVSFSSESGFDDWFEDKYNRSRTRDYDVCRDCFIALRSEFEEKGATAIESGIRL